MKNRKSNKFDSKKPQAFQAAAFANVVITVGDTACVMSTPLRKKSDVLRKKDQFHPALAKAAKKVHKTWLEWNDLSNKKKAKVDEPPKFLTIKRNVEIQVVPNNGADADSFEADEFANLGK